MTYKHISGDSYDRRVGAVCSTPSGMFRRRAVARADDRGGGRATRDGSAACSVAPPRTKAAHHTHGGGRCHGVFHGYTQCGTRRR